MTKTLLVELYQQQDRRRKRMLYELFSEAIHLNVSLPFIAQLINKELGVDGLITSNDIKYCRHYFKEENTNSKSKLSNIPKKTTQVEHFKEQFSKEINWTNPDEVNLNQSVKSKFSKS